MTDTTTLDPHTLDAEEQTRTMDGEPESIDEEYPRFPPRSFAALRPHILSRWVACVARFDEDVQYRDFDRVFGSTKPAIIRTLASVGPAYAASCIGVPISCWVRDDDGLRTGRAILQHADGRSEFVAPTVGYIEDARATPHGITAVLAIISNSMDEDLRGLADLGQLACAQMCMLQRMTAVPRVTDWGITVWTVASTRARLAQLTSLSHVAGQRVIRQLAFDEPLSALDLLPTERRWTAPAFEQAEAGLPGVAEINPGSIDTHHIVPDALTKDAFFTDDSGVTVHQGDGDVELGTITVATNGGHVKLSGKVTMRVGLASAGAVCALEIWKGSVGSGTLLDQTLDTIAADHTIVVIGRDTSPAASQTYKISVQIVGVSGDRAVFSFRRLFGENTKATT